MLVVALAVLLPLTAGAAWPAYRFWHSHRTGQFDTACREAVAEKDWPRLELIASKWTDWDQTADEGWVFLAEAAVQQENLELAVDCLGRVRDEYGGALEKLAHRGDILFTDLNRPYEAVANWERMLRIQPHADVARQRLIYFYSMALRRNAMLEHIHRAMELGCEPPEAYPYLLLAHDVTFSNGLSVVTKWIEAYPDDATLEIARAIYVARLSPYDDLIVLGGSAIAPGDVTLINGCLEKYPEDLEVLAFHLEKAMDEGDKQRVYDLLTGCPASAEQDPRFWRYRGWYLAEQNQHGEAERALRTALDLHPVDWRSRLLLAGVLRRLGRPDEAAEASRIALAGKDLHRELLELPNARSWDTEVGDRMYKYLEETGSELARVSLQRRIGGTVAGFR
jgi:tetratricopeptide (TPR) repeat protein